MKLSLYGLQGSQENKYKKRVKIKPLALPVDELMKDHSKELSRANKKM